jgi:hypothetical protein
MRTNYSIKRKWLTVLTGIGLLAGSPGAALAADSDWYENLFGGDSDGPDRMQVEADQAAVNALQSGYANDSRALEEAYASLRQHQRKGLDTSADRQNIQDLKRAVDTSAARLKALQMDGVAVGSVPSGHLYSRQPVKQIHGYDHSNHRRWNNGRHFDRHFRGNHYDHSRRR